MASNREDASLIPPKKSSPLDVQVGGAHYKCMAIQPVEYAMMNSLNMCQANVVKYVSRYRDKGGVQDLEKAKHFLDLLIAYENGEMHEKFKLTKSDY